jgi:hypothetical protein
VVAGELLKSDAGGQMPPHVFGGGALAFLADDLPRHAPAGLGLVRDAAADGFVVGHEVVAAMLPVELDAACQQGAVQGLVEQPHEHHAPVRLGEQVGPDRVVDGGVLDQPPEWPFGGGEVVKCVDAAGVKVERQHLALFGEGQGGGELLDRTPGRHGRPHPLGESGDRQQRQVHGLGRHRGSTGKLAPSIRASWLAL